MKQTHFYMKRENDVSIYVSAWYPDQSIEVKGIIQLAHGMAEHIMRYHDFATFLVQQGFIVYGNDHRGHGNSVTAPDEWGFFAEKAGFEKVVNDMHALTQHIQKENPHKPIFLFGHSMGSFLSRRYIQLYGKELSGVILSGTGASQGIKGKVGSQIAKWERFRHGPRTASKLMNQLTFGTYNKSFRPNRTNFDFLSRDTEVVDTYIQDDKCGFICSSSLYIDLLQGIEAIYNKNALSEIPKDLPILIISGDMDPVGDYGKGVLKVYSTYKELGISPIEVKLYPEARHELLNEINKEEVYSKMKDWLLQSLPHID